MVEKVKIGAQFAWEILSAAGREYGVVRANRMAAAIAYRTFFALTPLLLVAVGVFGAILGDNQEAQTEILDAIEQVGGKEVAAAVNTFLGSTFAIGDTAAIVGLALVFWTASSLFLEMQHDLNDIFGVPYEHTSGIVALVKKRGIGFLWALGLGLALVAVWLVNFAWRFFEGLFPDDLVNVHRVIALLAPLVSVVILPILFGLIFQTMTVITVRWRAIWYGASFTAAVFLAVAYGIGAYFAWDTDLSAFTVAGSVFVILLMTFVLAGVFLFGAQVTKVYADYLAGGDITGAGARAGETEAPRMVVAEPPQPAPVAAVLGFLGGLFVGWRKNRR